MQALKGWIATIGIAALLAAVSHNAAAAARGDDRPAPATADEPITRLILRPATGVDQATAISSARAEILGRFGIGARLQRRMSAGAQLLVLERPLGRASAELLSRQLMTSGHYRYVVPDYRRRHAAAPNDTRYAEQWHYHAPADAPGGANFEQAWDIQQGSTDVIVAVLDTGLVPHADIDSNILDGSGQVVPGYDFIDEDAPGITETANDGDGRDPDPSDPGDGTGNFDPSSWHGTHVAGTVAALTDNGLGVAGGGWNVRVMPVRVLGVGGGYLSDIVDAINWVAGETVPDVPAHGQSVKVINMSLGGGGACSPVEQDAIGNAIAAGITVVVAAGNEGQNAAQSSPGNCDDVITVHAHSRSGGFAGYSNFGSAVEISAPGGDFNVDDGILSTLDSGVTAPVLDGAFEAYQGTSMATPHVAAAAALLYSANPLLTPAEVLDLLIASARPFPSAGARTCSTSRCGAGLLDAADALRLQAGLPIGDTEPDAFSFAPRDGVALGATVTSALVTITGIDRPVTVSVDNGSYSIGCSGRRAVFTSAPGTITAGQQICVRHQAAASAGATVTTTLTVGSVAADFSSTTLPPDTTPGTFRFASRNNVLLDSDIVSSSVAINGINAPAPVVVDGGEYSIGCLPGGFTAEAGEILVGQRICVRHRSAADFSTATTTTLTIGGISGSFTSTTGAPDATPNRFSFRGQRNVPPDTLMTSAPVLIGGFNMPSPIGVSGGEYSIGCAPEGFTAADGMLAPGSTVCVRHTSAGTARTQTRTTLTVGGVSGAFVSTTAR